MNIPKRHISEFISDRLLSDVGRFAQWMSKDVNIDEVEIGGKFTNLDSYNQNMAKGLDDKMFFIEKLPFDKYNNWIFVDFGCADGVMENALAIVLEKLGVTGKIIGYDISESMINIAKSKFKDLSTPDLEVIFTANWKDVSDMVTEDNDTKCVLICSSVIHEVYSYANGKEDINWFWKIVNQTGFDYVCVRDMMASKSIEHPTDEKTLETFYNHVNKSKPELLKYIKEYEERWGSLKENKNFVHYLLKYRWTTNWTREVNENYFSIPIEEFLSKMRRFNIMHFEKFKVPFLENCWKEDFGIKIKDNTHIKAIFVK